MIIFRKQDYFRLITNFSLLIEELSEVRNRSKLILECRFTWNLTYLAITADCLEVVHAFESFTALAHLLVESRFAWN